MAVPGALLPATVKRRAAEQVAAFMGIALPPPTPEELGLPAGGAGPSGSGSGSGSADAGGGGGGEGQPEGKRRKRSRWGSEAERIGHAALPPGLSKEQEELYLAQLRVAELGSLIRSGHVPEQRSPSPEPVYNQQGQRLNTREARYRQKHEQERHELVQRLVQADSSYRPPPDYKPPEVKIEDRISIPTREYPDINFMGLIIGPRGKTLQQLERDTGAKVMIRGKASVKEGKGEPGREGGRGGEGERRREGEEERRREGRRAFFLFPSFFVPSSFAVALCSSSALALAPAVCGRLLSLCIALAGLSGLGGSERGYHAVSPFLPFRATCTLLFSSSLLSLFPSPSPSPSLLVPSVCPQRPLPSALASSPCALFFSRARCRCAAVVPLETLAFVASRSPLLSLPRPFRPPLPPGSMRATRSRDGHCTAHPLRRLRFSRPAPRLLVGFSSRRRCPRATD